MRTNLNKILQFVTYRSKISKKIIIIKKFSISINFLGKFVYVSRQGYEIRGKNRYNSKTVRAIYKNSTSKESLLSLNYKSMLTFLQKLSQIALISQKLKKDPFFPL